MVQFCAVMLLAGNAVAAPRCGVVAHSVGMPWEAQPTTLHGPLALSDTEPTRKTGIQKLLFLRVRYLDDREDPITEAEASATLAEVHAQFQRMSHGRYGIAPTISPVLRLDRNRADFDHPGGFDQLLDAAREAGIAAGYDYRNFDLEVVRHTGVPSFAGGNARLGVRGAQVQAGGAVILIHEMGHNLGLSHANFWDTSGPGVSLGSPPLPSNYASLPEPRSIPIHPDSVIGHDTVTGPGQAIEYGDPWDIMGTGDSEFSGAYQDYLGWLPDGSLADAPPGRSEFRIHELAAPELAGGGSPRLRIVRVPGSFPTSAGDRDYGIELASPRREIETGPGVLVRWLDRSPVPGSSLLLDATAGSSGVNADALVAPGRTFSDEAAGVHITVTAAGVDEGNFRWCDVVVVRGRNPANRSPEVNLGAATASVDPGVAVEFSVVAVDPEGDALAYRWDFGDGQAAHALNGASVTHAWKQSGDFNVRVEVTDMRGGVGSAQKMVRVGVPGTLRIRGTVRDREGRPIAGARVHNGVDSHGRPSELLSQARTDSRGDYGLQGLAPGSYAVSVWHPDFRFERREPVAVTDADPEVAGVDFLGTEIPTVSVSAASPVPESIGYTNLFTFTRTGATNVPVTVFYRFAGSARGSGDYTRPLVDRVTIPAGERSATLALGVIDDRQGEGSETVTVRVLYPTQFVSRDAQGQVVFTYFPGWETVPYQGGIAWTRTYPDYRPGEEAEATLVILDDDPVPPQTLGIVLGEDGRIHVDQRGAPGSTLILQSSSNLVDWVPIQTNRLPETDGLGQWMPRLSGAWFYRTQSVD